MHIVGETFLRSTFAKIEWTNENVRWNASKSEMSSEDFDWNTKICGTVWISTSCGKEQAISAHQPITRKLWWRFSPKRFNTFKQKTTGAWSALKNYLPHNFPRLCAPTISAPINVVRWVFASGQYMCPSSYSNEQWYPKLGWFKIVSCGRSIQRRYYHPPQFICSSRGFISSWSPNLRQKPSYQETKTNTLFALLKCLKSHFRGEDQAEILVLVQVKSLVLPEK